MKMKMMLPLMVVVAMVAVAAGQQECVSKLVPCVNYINGTVPPEKDCCDSIKSAVKDDLPCLCTVYNTPGLLQTFNVSVAQALNLTENCGVPIKLEQCNLNNTAQSPTSHNSPPAGVGGGSNGAEMRTIGIGILSVLMLLVSTLLY